jgi:hypothetical protein
LIVELPVRARSSGVAIADGCDASDAGRAPFIVRALARIDLIVSSGEWYLASVAVVLVLSGLLAYIVGQWANGPA